MDSWQTNASLLDQYGHGVAGRESMRGAVLLHNDRRILTEANTPSSYEDLTEASSSSSYEVFSWGREQL